MRADPPDMLRLQSELSLWSSDLPDPSTPLPNLGTLPVRSTWKDITNHPQFVRCEAALCLFLYPYGIVQTTSTDRSSSNGTVFRSRFRTFTSCRFSIDINTTVSLVSDTFNLSLQNVSCNSLSYPLHGRCSRRQAWTWLDLLFVHHLLFTHYKYLIFVGTSDRQRWPVWLSIVVRFLYMPTDRLHFLATRVSSKNLTAKCVIPSILPF
jgi:hypothetical protein